ncbi:MAG: hypothetical protein MR380_12615 [Lachnospiraceae bacterium]|nr:hypothetical protein [Lachnospiraceae bacterium]
MQLGRSRIGFTEKTVSKNAVAAMILGGTLIVIHLILMVLSVLNHGKLPFSSGVIESYLILFGIFGIFWAILSYDDEKTTNRYKALGILLNGVSLLLSVLVMAVGFMAYEI